MLDVDQPASIDVQQENRMMDQALGILDPNIRLEGLRIKWAPKQHQIIY